MCKNVTGILSFGILNANLLEWIKIIAHIYSFIHHGESDIERKRKT